MSERPAQQAASTPPYQQAATDPAPINLTVQPAPTVKPLRQARLAPVQLADNISDEDVSGTGQFNDDAPAGAPAKAEQADVSGVDGPEAPTTENPPT